MDLNRFFVLIFSNTVKRFWMQ